jgi:glycosyltransferase involved in cell wall biosynthesis
LVAYLELVRAGALVRSDERPPLAPGAMSRPRIAIVSPFIDKRHGTERRVAELISCLADEYEFHIYSPRVEDVDLRRVVWHRIPALPGPHLLAYLWWLLANHVWRWRDRHRGVVPDLVYSPGINCLDAHAVSVHIVFAGFRERLKDALRLSRNPILSWPRIIHRRLYYRLIAALEPYIYGRAEVCIAAVSKKLAADLKRFYSASSEISVIYNGLDLDCFSPQHRARLRPGSRQALSFRDDEFVLLLIGNDWRNKGLNCLLEAMAQVADPRLRALIVGSDNRRPFLPLISRLGMKERIQFCPLRADVEAYYAAADVYVGPSLDDAFAQPPAEAMACGLPVITSQTNGGSEIITHGCDGLVLEDPADSRGLADMIRNLVNDPGLCNRLGAAAAETASRYTWQQYAAQMRQLFERAARQSSRHNSQRSSQRSSQR